VQEPAVSVIVVDGVVLGAAVVPERQRARMPAEPARELRAHLVSVEVMQERRALLLRHALESNRVGDVDVERAAARLGMQAHDRVGGGVLLPGVGPPAVPQTVLARA
jgi:hypothetical protein